MSRHWLIHFWMHVTHLLRCLNIESFSKERKVSNNLNNLVKISHQDKFEWLIFKNLLTITETHSPRKQQVNNWHRAEAKIAHTILSTLVWIWTRAVTTKPIALKSCPMLQISYIEFVVFINSSALMWSWIKSSINFSWLFSEISSKSPTFFA